MSEATEPSGLERLQDFLVTVPAISVNDTPSRGIGAGVSGKFWWVKFGIDIDHPLAWRVVQEFGHVLNLVSLDEPLATAFKPVSPPPYLNGGPEDFLSWVIECPVEAQSPEDITKWLENRLPHSVNDTAQWSLNDDDGPDDEA